MQKHFCLRHSFFDDPKSSVFWRDLCRLEVKLCFCYLLYTTAFTFCKKKKIPEFLSDIWFFLQAKPQKHTILVVVGGQQKYTFDF